MNSIGVLMGAHRNASFAEFVDVRRGFLLEAVQPSSQNKCRRGSEAFQEMSRRGQRSDKHLISIDIRWQIRVFHQLAYFDREAAGPGFIICATVSSAI